jgi:hypothetical protein
MDQGLTLSVANAKGTGMALPYVNFINIAQLSYSDVCDLPDSAMPVVPAPAIPFEGSVPLREILDALKDKKGW